MSPNKNNSRPANEINSRTQHTYFDIAGPKYYEQPEIPGSGHDTECLQGNSGLKSQKSNKINLRLLQIIVLRMIFLRQLQ